jgi:hypothetical protein
MELKDALERELSTPVRSPGDADRHGEVAGLLGAYLRLEARAQAVLQETDKKTEGVSDGHLRGMTLHDAAERVLEDAGVPLHVRELGARIKAGGWRHPRSVARPDQILYQLAARLPRHPDRFRRVAPNTFALAKWDQEGHRPRGRTPHVPLFRGSGEPVGRRIGESDDHVSGEDFAWRSS